MATSWADDLPDVVVSNNADWNEAQDVLNGDLSDPPDPTDYLDLTGVNVRMELRPSAAAAEVALSASTRTGEITRVETTTGFANRAFVIRVGRVRMLRLAPGDYVRDIILERAAEVLFAGRGRVTIIQGVTRS